MFPHLFRQVKKTFPFYAQVYSALLEINPVYSGVSDQIVDLNSHFIKFSLRDEIALFLSLYRFMPDNFDPSILLLRFEDRVHHVPSCSKGI